MKPNQLATLVLRLLGIYCLIQGVPILGMSSALVVLARMNSQDVAGAFVASIVPGVLMLLVGILLLVFSVRLGEKLTLHMPGHENVSAISFEQIQVLAFATVGLLIFADGLPQLVNSIFYLVNWASSKKTGDTESQFAQSAYNFGEGSAAAGTVLKVVLGLILFFRARGFANFWRSLRTFATPKPPQT